MTEGISNDWMYFRKNINVNMLTFKQKLRTLKAFQKLLIIAGHKDNPSAHNCKTFGSRSGWKGEEQKNLSCISVLLPHLLLTLSQRCVSDHLVQPVKSLYLCKYLFSINSAPTFENFCYLYCLSFNNRISTAPNIEAAKYKGGRKGISKGTRDQIQSKNKQTRAASAAMKVRRSSIQC